MKEITQLFVEIGAQHLFFELPAQVGADRMDDVAATLMEMGVSTTQTKQRCLVLTGDMMIPHG